MLLKIELWEGRNKKRTKQFQASSLDVYENQKGKKIFFFLLYSIYFLPTRENNNAVFAQLVFRFDAALNIEKA